MDPVSARDASLVSLPSAATPAKPAVPFGDKIEAALRDANQSLQQADASAEAVATGEGDVVEAMIALSRADISLRLVLSMRNRLLEAYQEIMRLQV